MKQLNTSILFSLGFRAVFCNKVFYTSLRFLSNTPYMLVINPGGLQICRYRCSVLLTHYCVTALNGPLKIFLAKVNNYDMPKDCQIVPCC